MALALGANTALFTMIRGCCSGPPYPQPERLVRIHRMAPQRGNATGPLSPLNYAEDLRPGALGEGEGGLGRGQRIACR
jgi:hypothetical protein